MRRTSLTLLLALLVLPFAGCVESEDTITLKKDGSGTLSSSYTTDLKKYRELMLTFAAMGMGSPEAIQKMKDEDMPNIEHPAWMKQGAEKAKGYEITKSSQTIVEGKRSTRIEAKFTSLQEAAKGGAFALFTVELSEVEKSEKVPTGGWKLTITTPLGGSPDAMGGMDMKQMLPMFQAQLDTMKTGFRLQLPTKILETNGEKSEEDMCVSWTFEFDDLMDAEADSTMSVVFAGAEDLKLKAFKHAADMQALMVRAQQKPPAEKKDEAGKGDGEKKDDGGEGEADEAKPAEEKPAPKKDDAPADDGGK